MTGFSIFRRRRAYADLSEEIRQHLEEKTDALVGQGMSRRDAELAARRAFGNATITVEHAREAWGTRWLDDFAGDLRYGFRQFRRNPIVTAACVLTLGLGIGANAAIFSAVYEVILRPLPFRDPERLVVVSESRPGSVDKAGAPFARFRERTALTDLFAESAAYWDVSGGNGIVFGARGSVDRLQYSAVTSDFFNVLGIQPERGRGFTPGEGVPGSGSKVFLISDALWRSRLGADAAAIGRSYQLDGDAYTLVGVLPPGVALPERCDVWLPVGSLDQWITRDRVSHQFWMIGRLKEDVTVDRAQRELDASARRLARVYPGSDAGWRVSVKPLSDALVGDARLSLLLLFGAAAMVLFIACANVTSLLLARAVSRRREFALRAALGAPGTRLIRQALAESLMLAAAGALLAVVLARSGSSAIVAASAGSIPRFAAPRLSAPVFGFVVGLALLITLFVGLAPGLKAARATFDVALREGGRGAARSRRSRSVGDALVVGEIVLTTVLLAGAGLMLRSVAHLRGIDAGFSPSRIATVRIALPDAAYPQVSQRDAFLAELLRRLNDAPGLGRVAAIDRMPLAGDRNWEAINIVGRPALDPAHAPIVEARGVSPSYLAVMTVPLLRGRPLSDDDYTAGRPHVAIVSQTMARHFWPDVDPIGQRIVSAYNPADTIDVVGVAGDVKDYALDRASPPEMYTQYGWWTVMNIVAHGRNDAATVAGAVRREVSRLDGRVAVYDARSMDDVVAHSIARPRFELLLLNLFGALSLLLAAVGVYGLLAFSVGGRQREIGVRMALGARQSQILALFVGEGMRLAIAGVVIGGLAALAATRLLRSLLFELSPTDPLTFAGVAVLLTATCAVACWIPARRATRVDPTVALRAE
jgi:predicted permease